MDLLRIAGAAIAGTTAMTAFSYAVSNSKDKQFREPQILGKLIRRLFGSQTKTLSLTEGWILHYTVGSGFTLVYDKLWRSTTLKPDLVTGTAFGAVSGLIGISVWSLVLKAHPNPPRLQLKNYLGHLMLAHLVFGAVTTGTYRTIAATPHTLQGQ